MSSISPAWLQAFDQAMRDQFGIDHLGAGIGTVLIMRYAELPPEQAAQAFGRDFGLPRSDSLWPPPRVRGVLLVDDVQG